MGKFILKRIGISIVVLFLVTVVVFILVQMQPGNPYAYMFDPQTPKDIVEEMLVSVGYYDPIYIKYTKWVTRLLHGDLGYSIKYGIPVSQVIGSRLPNTILLSLSAISVSMLISVPVGILQAVKKGTFTDRALTVITLIGISIPSFFFGLIAIKVFAYDLSIFPISNMTTITKNYTGMAHVKDVFMHLVLPTAVLSMPLIAVITRYIKNSMLEVINQDYMVTAVGKGLTYNQAVILHGSKNILIPVITVVFMQIPSLFSGSLITETIFLWPGIGRLNYEAILSRDYPLIMGILVIMAVFVLFFNLLADILTILIDKRIKY